MGDLSNFQEYDDYSTSSSGSLSSSDSDSSDFDYSKLATLKKELAELKLPKTRGLSDFKEHVDYSTSSGESSSSSDFSDSDTYNLVVPEKKFSETNGLGERKEYDLEKFIEDVNNDRIPYFSKAEIGILPKDLSELTPSSIKKIENLLVLLALFTETMELISPVIKKGMRDMVGKIKSDFEKKIKNDSKFRESVEQRGEKLIEDCKSFSEKIKKGLGEICLPPWLKFWQNQFEEVTFKFRDDQKHYEHVLKNYLKNLLDEYTKPTNTKKFDFLSWADELSKETVNDELVFRITSVFYSKIYDYDYYDKNVELLDSKSLIEFASVCRLEKIGQFEVQKMRLVRNLLSHVDPDGVPTNIEKNGVLNENFKYILGLLKDVLIVWKDKKVVNTTDIMKRISEIEKENFGVSSGYVQKTNAKRENLAPGSLAGLPKESFGTSSYLRERLCKRKYSTFRDLNEMHAVIMKKAKVEHLRKIIPNYGRGLF